MSYKAFYPAAMTNPETGKTFDRTVADLVSRSGARWYDATRVAEAMFFAARERAAMTDEAERKAYAANCSN